MTHYQAGCRRGAGTLIVDRTRAHGNRASRMKGDEAITAWFRRDLPLRGMNRIGTVLALRPVNRYLRG